MKPTNDVLKTMSVLKRDPKYKEVLDWLNEVKTCMCIQTNKLKETDAMLRSAGRYQQLEDILKYMEDPEAFLG